MVLIRYNKSKNVYNVPKSEYNMLKKRGENISIIDVEKKTITKVRKAKTRKKTATVKAGFNFDFGF